jgi:hypothetical protein
VVRLTCKKETCAHVWKETKKQMSSEIVHCPKCVTVHHFHSKAIIPPVVVVTGKKEVEKKPKTPYINPPEEFAIHQKCFDGHSVSFYKGYRTVEKDK